VKNSQQAFRPSRARASAANLATALDFIDAGAAQARNATLLQQLVRGNRGSATTAAIAGLVQLSSRYAWPVILGFLLLAIISGSYFTRHFAITTDSKNLLSS